MKNFLFSNFWILPAFIYMLTSCNNDEAAIGGIPAETFHVHMFVTNNANEDLVYNSPNYIRTGEHAETFCFDTWNVYLEGKLIQSDKDFLKNRYKSVNLHQGEQIKLKNISLNTNGKLQTLINNWNKKYLVEYKITSVSLFGNTKEHIIRMELKGIENELGYITMAEYTISVDGVELEVFYPKSWGINPQSQYENHILYPYFILNVDKLPK